MKTTYKLIHNKLVDTFSGICVSIMFPDNYHFYYTALEFKTIIINLIFPCLL